MCLIVFKRNEKSQFTNRQFKNMIAKNPHGLGIMWREDGRVKTIKVMGSDKEKFKAFQEIRNEVTYAMHARIKTHGLINEANCHPYKILDIDDGDAIDLYVMHNGTLDAPEIDKNMSDTWHYMEYVLKPLIKADISLLWDNKHIQSMITKAIGYSKLLFMRSDDVQYPVLIFNSNVGTESSGCWLSNSFGCSEPYTSSKQDYTRWPGYGHEFRREPTFEREHGTWNPTTHTWDYGSKTAWTQDEREAAWADMDKNKTKDYEKQGNLLLPKQVKDDKIVELKAHNMLVANPDENLLYLLRELRSLSDSSIKDFIKDDPDTTADIILGLYAKNTMKYETIINLINDPVGIDNMVNLIRHMAVDEDKSKTNALARL